MRKTLFLDNTGMVDTVRLAVRGKLATPLRKFTRESYKTLPSEVLEDWMDDIYTKPLWWTLAVYQQAEDSWQAELIAIIEKTQES